MKTYIALSKYAPAKLCCKPFPPVVSLRKPQAHAQKPGALFLTAVSCFTDAKEKKEYGFSQSCRITEAGRDF